jgi:hypothetical protein
LAIGKANSGSQVVFPLLQLDRNNMKQTKLNTERMFFISW